MAHRIDGFPGSRLAHPIVRLASVVGVALVLVLGGSTPAPASHQFGDVPTSNIHHDNIDWLAGSGVTGGCSVSPPLYCPGQAVTREQMATFLRKGLVVVGPAKPVNCPGESLQAAIDDARSGDVLNVSGTCNESVVIPARLQDIVLNGGGSATINGTDPAIGAAISVRGSGIRITGFTIGGTAGDGVDVLRGGYAQIDNNVINGTPGIGILVFRHSGAQIHDNTVTNNAQGGVFVQEGSAARIGFGTTTTPNPNTIQDNGGIGIIVQWGSHARICCNTIVNNTGGGILVHKNSHAEIANNTINANVGDGIQVGQVSSVDLGRDTGSSILELPNTTTVNNTGIGISCFRIGSANGRLGTLNGAGGDKSFPGASFCVDSLNP